MDHDFYLRHGALSDPGDLASAFDGLPDDVAGLCAAVQGILLHDYFGGVLYGDPPAGFDSHSRATLPVRQRLAAILACNDAPLVVARPPAGRCVGTCRDFALMLTAMLRHKGRSARVRCGFARYFGGEGFEDHWVCETWIADEMRWALADPQLDAAHRAHLAITFDPSDMPRERFLCAWEAWRAVRDEGLPANRFGHGDDTGLWFLEVNLARDLHALAKQETSAWDTWRAAEPGDRKLDSERLENADALARLAQACGGLDGPDMKGGGEGSLPPPPPWGNPS